jgi:hypothetical protein
MRKLTALLFLAKTRRTCSISVARGNFRSANFRKVMRGHDDTGRVKCWLTTDRTHHDVNWRTRDKYGNQL